MTVRVPTVWRWVCLAGVLAAFITFVTVGREPLNRGLELLRHMGPLPFYAVLAVCISLGAPATPFLLVAGAAFGFGTNLAGVTVSFALSLVLSYFFASRLFKSQLDKFLQQKAGSLNHALRQNTVAAIVLVRLTPGFPYILQNCFLAAVCPSFRVFFLASLPPLLFVAMMYTALGGGLMHANIPLFVMAAFVLIGVLLVVRHVALRPR